jgi:hypothetical protein
MLLACSTVILQAHKGTYLAVSAIAVTAADTGQGDAVIGVAALLTRWAGADTAATTAATARTAPA